MPARYWVLILNTDTPLWVDWEGQKILIFGRIEGCLTPPHL